METITAAHIHEAGDAAADIMSAWKIPQVHIGRADSGQTLQFDL
jgi:hypothetical protein